MWASCSSCCVTKEPGVTAWNQGKSSEADANPTAALVQALTYSVTLLFWWGAYIGDLWPGTIPLQLSPWKQSVQWLWWPKGKGAEDVNRECCCPFSHQAALPHGVPNWCLLLEVWSSERWPLFLINWASLRNHSKPKFSLLRKWLTLSL